MRLPAPFTWCQLSWTLCSSSTICTSAQSSPAICWSPWVISFPCPHIFMAISFCLIFPAMGFLAALPLASLFRRLSNHTWRDREAFTQQMWLSPNPNLLPFHLPFFFFFFYRFSRPRRLSFSHHGPRGWMARGEAGHESLCLLWLILDIVRPQHWPHVHQLWPSLDSDRGFQRLWIVQGVKEFAFDQSVLWKANQGVCMEGDIFSWKRWVSTKAFTHCKPDQGFMNKTFAERHIYWDIYWNLHRIYLKLYFRFLFLGSWLKC